MNKEFPVKQPIYIKEIGESFSISEMSSVEGSAEFNLGIGSKISVIYEREIFFACRRRNWFC
jgi:hypothetical protein